MTSFSIHIYSHAPPTPTFGIFWGRSLRWWRLPLSPGGTVGFADSRLVHEICPKRYPPQFFPEKRIYRDSISTYFWLFSSDPLVVADLSMVTVHLFQAKNFLDHGGKDMKRPVSSFFALQRSWSYHEDPWRSMVPSMVPSLVPSWLSRIVPWSYHDPMGIVIWGWSSMTQPSRCWFEHASYGPPLRQGGQVRDWYQYSCGTLEEHPFTS